MKKNNSKKNILILHGWAANSQDHWFQRAKRRFERKGYQVEVPDLVGGYFPNLEDWLATTAKFKPDENWILIGHSIGGVAILKYLEKAKKPVKQIILIATPFYAMHFGAIENFFQGGFNWFKIKKNTPKINIINEDNDPMIPVEHGKLYAKNLEGELHILRGFNHFHTIDLGFLERLFEQ